MGYGHLRLDPALLAYLRGPMTPADQAAMRARWAEAMRGLLNFLYEQLFQNTQMAAQLTLLELPNLLAVLDWWQEKLPPEEVVEAAGRVETLVAPLGRPQALARVVAVRNAAEARLGEWGPARFLAASHTIDRLLDTGDLRSALAVAQTLRADCLHAGESAYPGAAFDIALAHWQLGRVLQRGRAAEAALEPLAAAQERFEKLAAVGNRSAERMAAVAITERGGCLLALGRLDEAAAAYEESIRRTEKWGDRRSVAVGKGQLGTVRLHQGRYADALAAHREAKDTFEALGEPGTVATAWHQIGMMHRMAKQFDEAERAYRQALAIEVQRQDRRGEAQTLDELGNLYGAMGRLDDAVTFFRQAADKYVELQDKAGEGIARNNAGFTLVRLGRYDEARQELLRAIECNEPYGHAAEPWTTWEILHDLEQATGHPQAAHAARQQALQAFLAYRRAGGENHQGIGPQLCQWVAQAIHQHQPAPAEQELAQCAADPDLPAYLKALLPKLQAILRGHRDPDLADDPSLAYDDAAELLLLLERL